MRLVLVALGIMIAWSIMFLIMAVVRMSVRYFCDVERYPCVLYYYMQR